VRKLVVLALTLSACSSPADPLPTTTTAAGDEIMYTEYIIGDKGPGGGVIVVASGVPFPCGPNGESRCNYLEVSPYSAETQLPWAESAFTDQEVAGAAGSAIGTGWQNTADILAQGNTDPTKSAAAYAAAYEFGGVSDWFLPSRDEVQAMIYYREIVGGFTGELTWTSSERNSSKSWQQHTQQGHQYVYAKSAIAYVRPMRTF